MVKDEIMIATVKSIIRDTNVPVTYRNEFMRFLKWMAERGYDIGDEIERTCVLCGKSITIFVYPDKSYTGGHFWDFDMDPESEYWECNKCFESWEDDEKK